MYAAVFNNRFFPPSITLPSWSTRIKSDFLIKTKSKAERVHPEVVWIDWVAKGYMTCDAFIEAQFAEDAEGEGQSAFEVLALFELVVEFGRSGELSGVGLSRCLV